MLNMLGLPCIFSMLRFVLEITSSTGFFVMAYLVYLWIKSIQKLPNFPTIQKPYLCRKFSMTSFKTTIKLTPFIGVNFKRWQTRVILWLTAIKVYWVVDDLLEGIVDPEKDRLFKEASIIFIGVVLSVLGDKLVAAYLHMRDAREL